MISRRRERREGHLCKSLIRKRKRRLLIGTAAPLSLSLADDQWERETLCDADVHSDGARSEEGEGDLSFVEHPSFLSVR